MAISETIVLCYSSRLTVVCVVRSNARDLKTQLTHLADTGLWRLILQASAKRRHGYHFDSSELGCDVLMAKYGITTPAVAQLRGRR